jgi:hypothetical protein
MKKEDIWMIVLVGFSILLDRGLRLGGLRLISNARDRFKRVLG